MRLVSTALGSWVQVNLRFKGVFWRVWRPKDVDMAGKLPRRRRWRCIWRVSVSCLASSLWTSSSTNQNQVFRINDDPSSIVHIPDMHSCLVPWYGKRDNERAIRLQGIFFQLCTLAISIHCSLWHDPGPPQISHWSVRRSVWTRRQLAPTLD